MNIPCSELEVEAAGLVSVPVPGIRESRSVKAGWLRSSLTSFRLLLTGRRGGRGKETSMTASTASCHCCPSEESWTFSSSEIFLTEVSKDPASNSVSPLSPTRTGFEDFELPIMNFMILREVNRLIYLILGMTYSKPFPSRMSPFGITKLLFILSEKLVG